MEDDSIHVLRRDNEDVLRRALDFEVAESRGRGRSNMTWRRQVEEHADQIELKKEDAIVRAKWRDGVYQLSRPLFTSCLYIKLFTLNNNFSCPGWSFICTRSFHNPVPAQSLASHIFLDFFNFSHFLNKIIHFILQSFFTHNLKNFRFSCFQLNFRSPAFCSIAHCTCDTDFLQCVFHI